MATRLTAVNTVGSIEDHQTDQNQRERERKRKMDESSDVLSLRVKGKRNE